MVANMLDCHIVVNDFKLQTYTLEKRHEPSYPSAMGQIDLREDSMTW